MTTISDDMLAPEHADPHLAARDDLHEEHQRRLAQVLPKETPKTPSKKQRRPRGRPVSRYDCCGIVTIN